MGHGWWLWSQSLPTDLLTHFYSSILDGTASNHVSVENKIIVIAVYVADSVQLLCNVWNGPYALRQLRHAERPISVSVFRSCAIA